MPRVSKTVIEYNVQENIGHGWEDVHADDNLRLAKDVLKDYIKNGQGSYRIIKRRVPKEGV